METLKKYFPYLAGLSTSVIFGLSFIFTAEGLIVYSPMDLIANRFLLAGVFLLILYLLKIIKLDYKNKPVKKLFFLSSTQPLSYYLFETYGIKFTNSSISGIMIALVPIVVLILGFLFLKQKPSLSQWIYVTLSVIGAVIIVIASNVSLKSSNLTLGFILLTGAVLSAAGFNILSREASKEFTPIEITFFMMSVSAVFYGIISVIINKGFSGYLVTFTNSSAFVTSIYLGVLSSVAAFFLCNYMISKLSVPKAAVFTNLVSVISVLAGIIIRNEPFSFMQITGAVIILIGIFGVNLSE